MDPAELDFQDSDSHFHPTPVESFPALPTDTSETARLQMRELALSSIYFLAKTVLGYTKLRPSPHGEMCEFLDFLERERLEGNHDLNRSAFYAPRDTYKTTLATITRAIQRGLRDPNKRGLIVADTADNAELFGREISNHFQHNPLLRWLFPEVIPENFNKAKWSESGMTLRRTAYWSTPTFTLIGAFGGIESRHFDWIIPDDLVTEKCLRSDVEMDKLNHWTGGLEQLLVNDVEGVIDYVGSHKKKGDTYEHQEKYYGALDSPPVILGPHAVKKGNICTYSRAIFEGGVNIFPYDAEKHSGISDSYIQRMKKNEPQRFWAQLMNSPKGTGLNTFRIEDVNYFRPEPNGLIRCVRDGQVIHSTNVWSMDRIMVYDPAVAKKGTQCKQALHVIAKGSHPFRFVLASHVAHTPPDEMIEMLFEWQRVWQCSFISIERRGFQGWVKYTLDMLSRERGLPYLPVVEWPAEGSPKAQWSKTEHIKALQPAFRAGYWWLQEDQLELLEEIEFYPNVRWDDGLDALGQHNDYAPYHSDEAEVRSVKKREDNTLEFAGLGKPNRDKKWNEQEFLRRFNHTGYGLRTG